MLAVDGRARLLQVLLQLQRIALHGDVQVAHRRAAGQVAHRTARQKDGKPLGTGHLADMV
jgi:hypothetical protein